VIIVANDAVNSKDKYGVTFIDFLFTIAVFVGIFPEAHGVNGYNSIFSQEWIKNFNMPSENDVAVLLSFMLCFFTVVLSWFGYHNSMLKFSHKGNHVFGMFRFMIDVTLLLLYILLLVNYDKILIVANLLIFIFFLYFCWDLLLVREHKDYYLNKKMAGLSHIMVYRGEYVTIFWFLAIIVIRMLHEKGFIVDLITLVSALFFVIIAYRINKIILIWEKILEKLFLFISRRLFG